MYAHDHSALDGEASYVRVGSALPRWRPPPHSRLPDLKFKLKSLLRVHEIKGIRLRFGSLHAEPVLGLRLLVFCINKGSWSSIEDGDFGHEHSAKIIVIFV